MTDQPRPQTIGELVSDLPVGEWVELPEYGVRVRHWPDPVRVDVMPVPTLHTTPAELHTELYWAMHIEPVAGAHGFHATELHVDHSDRHRHLLKDPAGQLVLVVRTDRQPTCCPMHDRETTSLKPCEPGA